MTKKLYIIKGREEGRGKPFYSRFRTLKEASTYIQERWQGIDYMDGYSAFHTDYCTYELSGFNLLKIGKVKVEGNLDPYIDRTFVFDDPIQKD